jgi:hypothetical protein
VSGWIACTMPQPDASKMRVNPCTSQGACVRSAFSAVTIALGPSDTVRWVDDVVQSRQSGTRGGLL